MSAYLTVEIFRSISLVDSINTTVGLSENHPLDSPFHIRELGM